jgi:hypothetical protein
MILFVKNAKVLRILSNSSSSIAFGEKVLASAGCLTAKIFISMINTLILVCIFEIGFLDQSSKS